MLGRIRALWVYRKKGGIDRREGDKRGGFVWRELKDYKVKRGARVIM